MSNTINNINNLPAGWKYVKLGEVFTIERGGSPRPIEDYITNSDDGINWIKIGDTKGVSKYITKTTEKIKPEGLKKSRIVYDGDFILSNSMSFGRPYIMKTSGCIHDGWLVIRQNESVDKEYLFYSLSSNLVFSQFSKLAKGSTVRNLNIEAVKQVYISLPPLPTQLAIVSKIEELFSELDKGIEQLKTAQQQLKTYRQAVLKWAFEGKLTNENVKDGQLPDGWKWVKLGEFAFVTKLAGFEFTKYVKYKDSGDIPVIRAQNVSKHGFVERNFIYVDRELMEKLSRSRIYGGEILMVFVGAGLGNVGIVPNNKEYFLGPNVAKIALDEGYYNKFIYYFLSSTLGFGNINVMSKATAQGSISMGNIREVIVPLIPIKEQHNIVNEIESRFSVADKMEESINNSLQQAETLRQSILKKAFEGRLI